MNANFVHSGTFDKRLGTLLKAKKRMNVAKSRFDMESVKLSKKPDFIIDLLTVSSINSVTYKILFWEKDELLDRLLTQELHEGEFKITTSYKNGKHPGVVFVDGANVDGPFLGQLLKNHFNYEMAKEPALNLRVQICVDQEKFITIFDIYDDRGFDVYYLRHGK